MADVWTGGGAYERYMGRWSRLVAAEFVRWLAPATDADWLDVGCGTGALTEAVLRATRPRSTVAVEPSAAFAAEARARLAGGVPVLLATAAALPLPAGAVDYAVSGLVLNFVPDVGAALAEQRRVVRRGGSAAAYVWDYAGGMQMLRRFWDAAATVDPDAPAQDEARFPLARPEALRAAFTAAGFAQVVVDHVEVPTVFADFEDYWQPFLGGTGPAPRWVAGLGEDRATRLREQLRATLPTGENGRVRLAARALTVRGVAP